VKKLKMNFLIFSLLGLIVIISVSAFSIFEHRKIIKQQQQINLLYKTINISLSEIHNISELVGSLKGANQRSLISVDDIDTLKELIVKAKQNEDFLIQWINNNKNDHDMKEIIKIFMQKEFKQRVNRFIDKAEDLIDFSLDTQVERINNIQSISKMSQNSLDVLFSKVIEKVSVVQKRFIKKIERIGLFLVSICLLEILFVWLFVFTPLYNMIKKQHDSLNELKDTLENASIAKNDFIANISHEIRTPMTAIIGYIDLLKRNEIPGEEKANAYDIISRNADHLLCLIDEVLDISKMESGKLAVYSETTNINSILNEVFSLMQVKAKLKNLDFQVTYKTPIYKFIKTDPKRFKQILFNLVGNSIKFTSNGSINLNLRVNKNNNLEMRIVDTGCGIEESKRSFLFKPFTQADNSIKRKYGGTGLGLVISERLASKLKAKLIIEKSTPGKGTTMLITFSKDCFEDKTVLVDNFYSKVNNSSANQFKKYQNEFKLGRSKILVVDDAKENVFLFKNYLEKVKANVDVAFEGREALKKIKNNNYDLVLLDLQMPEMSGYEVVSEAKKYCPSLKIFALTAHAMESEKTKTKKAGFDGHITKPISAEDLINIIYNYLYVS